MFTKQESKTFGLGRGLLMVHGGVGPAPEQCFCLSSYHIDIVLKRFMIVFDIFFVILLCVFVFVMFFLTTLCFL